MEDAKNLETQHRRILRGKEDGMLRKQCLELGRPSFALSLKKGKRKPISKCEMVDCKEGVGGGHSTEHHNDNTTLCREGPLLCS
jgi:hypothetical protein